MTVYLLANCQVYNNEGIPLLLDAYKFVILLQGTFIYSTIIFISLALLYINSIPL